LRLNDYDIANISRDYPNRAVDACREMLSMWLRTVPSPTWGKLDDAIKSLRNVSTPHSRCKFMTLTVISPTIIM